MLKKINKKEIFYTSLVLLIAAVIRAISMVVFIVPYKIAPGGVTGISSILNNLYGWNVPILMFVINAPVLILAFLFINKKFAVLTIIEAIFCSAFIALFENIPFVTFENGDIFVAAICGGALNGIGLGFLLKVNASTGGSDIVGLLIQNKFPQVKIAWLILAIDIIIAISSGMVFHSLAVAIYSFVALFVNSFVAEKIQRGFVSTVEFKIITSKPEEVTDFVVNNFHRSVTLINAEGAYTHKQRKLLFVIVRKRQAIKLKKVILEIDPKAFFYVSNVYEITGNGFMDNTTPKSKIK